MRSLYLKAYISNLKLALPLILSYAGQMVVGLADTLMVGKVGAVPLAASAFANGIFINVLVFGIGISIALTAVVGKAYGAMDLQACRFWFKQGLLTNLLTGVVLLVLGLGMVFAMPHMGQAEAVWKGSIPYFIVLMVSILPLQLFFSYKQFAEGLSNTKISMYITLVGNLLNVLLNYILIYGHWGFPALGLMGAGIGTLVSRLFMALAFVYLFKRLRFFKQFHHNEANPFSKSAFVTLMRLGFPIGLQFVIEVLAFSIGSIMMGWLDVKSLAAHQIVLSIASLTYMMSSGIGSAATIRVSIFRGMNRPLSLKRSAYASLHLVFLFMSITSVLLVLCRMHLPALFISDAEVIRIASGLIVVAGLFQIFDGVQVVGLGILRGMEDVTVPVVMAAFVYLCISIPAGYLLTFTLGFGAVGIWFGYLIGLACYSTFLVFRFRWLYARHYIITRVR